MYRTTLILTLLISTSYSFGYSIERKHTVHFEKDSDYLSEHEAEVLSVFMSSCDLSLEHRFTLQGHTDSDGSIDYNRVLSERRIGSVKSYIVDEFSIITMEERALSELKPIASNDNRRGMAQNRRVTLIFEANYFENIDEVNEKLQEGSVNHFEVNLSEEEILISKQGVRVCIPLGSFVDQQGRPVESAEIILTESLDPLSFLAHDLQTQSADGILESGGMIRLQAFSESGEALQIKEGNELLLAIPDDVRKDRMQTFLTADDGRTWIPNEPLMEPDLGMGMKPARPGIEIRAFKPPRFKLDKSKMPLYPAEPPLPSEPELPLREDFNKGFSLEYAFKKKQRLADEEAKFIYAMRVYNKRLQRYGRKLDRYDERCEAYSIVLNEYLTLLPAWEVEMGRQLDEFKGVTLLNAKQAYDQEVARIRAEHSDAIFSYEKSLDDWTDDYLEAIDMLGIPEGQSIDKYVFRATKLGWVNIDRFAKYKDKDKHEIVAYLPDDQEELVKIFVVLNSGRSMLQLRPALDRYILTGFPKKEVAELLSYRVVDGRLEMYNEIFVGKNEFEIEYRPSSISELRTLLKAKGSSLGTL